MRAAPGRPALTVPAMRGLKPQKVFGRRKEIAQPRTHRPRDEGTETHELYQHPASPVIRPALTVPAMRGLKRLWLGHQRRRPRRRPALTVPAMRGLKLNHLTGQAAVDLVGLGREDHFPFHDVPQPALTVPAMRGLKLTVSTIRGRYGLRTRTHRPRDEGTETPPTRDFADDPGADPHSPSPR